jgi:hypothetical protein
MPALSRCLGQARLVSPRSFPDANRCLFSLFGLDLPTGALPVAAVTHWADFPDQPSASHGGCWLRIDPVHLRPDMGKLLLFDASHLAISAEEAHALIGELNDHLRGEGLLITAGRSPSRWYLQLPRAPRIETVAPARANGQHIDPWIARGEDAREWQRRIIELQMLMHQSTVNQRREASGAPTINSVWPWGAGSLAAVPAPSWERVITNDVTAEGLARAAGVPVGAPAPLITGRPDPGQQWLMVLGDGLSALERRDVEAWQAALASLDRQSIAPLRAAVASGVVSGLHLHQPNAHYCLQRADFWRFWRSAPVIVRHR